MSRTKAAIKLTQAEEEFVLRERHRIALDSRDWNSEPYASDAQLREMSGWRSDLLLTSLVWQRDDECCVLRNTAHPDNADWAARQLLCEAMRQSDSKLGYHPQSS